jgi:hypothetical protein
LSTKAVENLVDSVGNIPVNYGNVQIIATVLVSTSNRNVVEQRLAAAFFPTTFAAS